MVSLYQDNKGNYRARKRLPEDVREDYGCLYGPRFEAKFSAPAVTKRQDAEQQFHGWRAEVNARIAADLDIDLPQLRDDLFRRASLPRHIGPP
jgi:hypothetical protein